MYATSGQPTTRVKYTLTKEFSRHTLTYHKRKHYLRLLVHYWNPIHLLNATKADPQIHPTLLNSCIVTKLHRNSSNSKWMCFPKRIIILKIFVTSFHLLCFHCIAPPLILVCWCDHLSGPTLHYTHTLGTYSLWTTLKTTTTSEMSATT